ncbi:AraC family transcriptional regulator [bacterium]|nr:AraC family transcriptional regulator [bacterium]
MKSQPMVSTLDTLALIECLKAHGVSQDELLRSTGVDANIMTNPDFRIPLADLIRLWKMAAEVTNDPSIAIQLRQNYGGHFVHFVNHMAMNSHNVREALQLYTRYGKLLGNIFSYELRRENKYTAFVFSIDSPDYQNPWIPEYHLSLILYLAPMLGIHNVNMEEVRFMHACGSNIKKYTDFFKAPVYFEQPENAILISDEILNIEITSFDAHLQAVLKKQAEDILASLPKENTFLASIERIIFQNLASGILDVELVAAKLNIHRSTLHRKLKENGTTFIKILTTIRKNLAKLYLDQEMNIDQIAFLLGYSNRSNFQVAFKNWFGVTPVAYKK